MPNTTKAYRFEIYDAGDILIAVADLLEDALYAKERYDSFHCVRNAKARVYNSITNKRAA